jgi:DNA modification methylase
MMLAPPQRPKYLIQTGDCRELLKALPEKSVNCCVTSPPYFGLRDYGHAGQIGIEKTPSAYVAEMVDVFSGVHRALRDDGTFWLNLGDSYAGSWGARGRGAETNAARPDLETKHGTDAPARNGFAESSIKPKDLVGIPWRVAFAFQEFGWYLRDAIVWAKPNGMPGSQQDRCTSSYEMIFHFSKSSKYWSDFDAIKTPPRESTLVRTAQNVQAQAGSHRANGGGKTNGPMKAVGGKTDKQRGHSRQHAGSNERWDAMEKSEQQARPAMMRNVWFVSPGGYPGAHFAVMPEEIARRCILAGCPDNGIVLDPFGGAGTTGVAAVRNGRRALLLELNPDYAVMADKRIRDTL